MSKPVTILIADDHSLIRSGLHQILTKQMDCRILEAGTGVEALDIIRKKSPNIAILDIQMPEMTGFEVALKVRKEALAIDLIFLTMHNDEHMFNKAMDAGIKGFVLKDNTVAEITQCVKTVMDGKFYLSPDLSDYMVRRFSKNRDQAQDQLGLHDLTPSERTILKLVSEMKTNQEMADEIGISIKTVQNHRNNICKKLDIQGTHSLLKFALEHKTVL